MSTFPFRMSEELKAAAAAQAERAGVSMNQYLLAIVATRVGAQAEAERYFATRASRAVLGRALATLSRAGVGRAPELGDELSADLAERLVMKEPSAR